MMLIVDVEMILWILDFCVLCVRIDVEKPGHALQQKHKLTRSVTKIGCKHCICHLLTLYLSFTGTERGIMHVSR